MVGNQPDNEMVPIVEWYKTFLNKLLELIPKFINIKRQTATDLCARVVKTEKHKRSHEGILAQDSASL